MAVGVSSEHGRSLNEDQTRRGRNSAFGSGGTMTLLSRRRKGLMVGRMDGRSIHVIPREGWFLRSVR